MNKCPCGSGNSFDACCRPFISGEKTPQSAEELLRSRYTAYTLVDMDYILKTTSESQKKLFSVESNRKWAESSEWKGMEIVSSEQNDNICNIEFIAHYSVDGLDQKHHEYSEFKKKKDKWVFNGGKIVKNKPFVRGKRKIPLNSKCPCGSGKKYKKCCAAK